MNLGGDGQDTCPFVDAANTRYKKTHYDISKLNQWDMTLNHAQNSGIAPNIVLSATEDANERWLNTNGRIYSLDYDVFANSSVWLKLHYRFMEYTGLSTF